MKLLFSTFVLGMVASSSAVISDAIEDIKATDDAASKNRLRGLQNNNRVTVLVTLTEDKNTGIAKKCETKANGSGGSVKYVYKTVLNGCALEVPSAAVKKMAEDPEIELLEEDGTVYAADCTKVDGGCEVSNPTWGIDAMDQCAGPVDGEPFFKKPATGVNIYIADTGIRGTHTEFSGMIDPTDNCHADFTTEGNPLNDGNGHGTHVAGTTAGHTYGVSYCSTAENDCKLCAVKVLGSDGGGTLGGVVAGIDHTAANCQAQGKKCVLNMSLGGGASTTLDNAVKNAVAAGVTVVVAAGNSSYDACRDSPARAPEAITVGSTEESYITSYFSNYGSCVDIWQPGSYITSAGINSNTSTRTMSGTSMASPHAAGNAATILGEGASTPAQVQSILIANSFRFGTKNGYAQDFPTTDGCGASPTPPSPTPPTDSPPPPAPGDCTSYTQKSVCQENNCVWTGHPQRGSCGDGSDSPPPPSPTPDQDCTTCSGLGGGACNKCPNCSWGGGSRGCQG